METLSEKLEALIDRYGLNDVVKTISEICELKASHISENWQDDGLAKTWERAGFKLGKMEKVTKGI